MRIVTYSVRVGLMCNGERKENNSNMLKRHCDLLRGPRWSFGSYMETDS
jgi:hypothetical protein